SSLLLLQDGGPLRQGLEVLLKPLIRPTRYWISHRSRIRRCPLRLIDLRAHLPDPERLREVTRTILRIVRRRVVWSLPGSKQVLPRLAGRIRDTTAWRHAAREPARRSAREGHLDSHLPSSIVA